MADQTEPVATVETAESPSSGIDDALDAIDFGDDGGDEPEAPEQPEADETADETAGDTPPEVDREALARALGVLKRDNVPDEVIDGLLQSPDKLLAWAEKAGKRQGDIDKILGVKRPDEAEETPEKAKAEPTGSPATDEAVAELVRPFADEMGSEHAQATLTKLASHVRESTLAEVRPVLGRLAEMVEGMMVRSARDSLRERFPQVGDESKWAGVMKTAQTLSKTGGFSDMDSLIAAAAKLEFGEFSVRDKQQDLAKRHKARSNGTPTPPRQTRQKPPATHKDRIEAALDDVLGPED
jgi:hypothetical protein